MALEPTVEEMMQCIRIAVGDHTAPDMTTLVQAVLGQGTVTRTPLFDDAMQRLIAAGDVEETLEYGNGLRLRLIGEARHKAGERGAFSGELAIQETFWLSADAIDSVFTGMREFATTSALMPPPGVESGWFAWDSGRTFYPGEIPFDEIEAGAFRGPLVLHLRIVRRFDLIPFPEDGTEADWENWTAIPQGLRYRRVGGIYPITFDYTPAPTAGSGLYLVGRIPNELVTPMPFDGVYVCGTASAAGVEPKPAVPWIARSDDGIDSARDSNWACTAYLGKDPTGEQFACLALEKAGIPHSMDWWHGVFLKVPPEQRTRATRLLQADSERWGYWARFFEVIS